MQARNPADLTPAARVVLLWLYENRDEDDLASDGLQVWYGLNKTNFTVLRQLLECVFVRPVGCLGGHYEITGNAIRYMEGKPPYTDGSGRDFWTIEALMKANLNYEKIS